MKRTWQMMVAVAFGYLAAGGGLLPAAVHAADSDEELQKKLANPVADLISLPFQYTGNFHVGPMERPQHTLNIQPVYPIRLGSEWKLINRVIAPLLSNPASTATQDRVEGIGDITYEGFFSPEHKPGGMIWGVGPIISLPTATNDRLGSGKWSAGPAILALAQPGKWSAGALVTQLWSFAGDDHRQNVSQLQVQPLLSYRLSSVHTIAYLGTITADWQEDRSSQRWTVPLGLSYSILTKPAGMGPVNFIFGGGYNVVRPDNAGDWFVRFQVNFIIPK